MVSTYMYKKNPFFRKKMYYSYEKTRLELNVDADLLWQLLNVLHVKDQTQ